MKYYPAILFFFGVFILGCFNNAETEMPPNILFIMSDDHAYQAISAYDDRLIQTPNIDRIANEGIIFKNACVTNSICAPSRAVILTGKHSHLNGKIDNHAKFDDSQTTFPQLFQKAGYQTAMFGKLHFGNKILLLQNSYYLYLNFQTHQFLLYMHQSFDIDLLHLHILQ